MLCRHFLTGCVTPHYSFTVYFGTFLYAFTEWEPLHAFRVLNRIISIGLNWLLCANARH